MTLRQNAAGALRRTGHAIGRFWQELAAAAAPPKAPLNDKPAQDYYRFPWF